MPTLPATHRNSGKSWHSGLGGETAPVLLSLCAFLRGSKPQLTFPFRTPSGPMTLSKMCLATCESTADRGSSSRKMSELLYTARARLTRCRCPPDRLMPWRETGENKTCHTKALTSRGSHPAQHSGAKLKHETLERITHPETGTERL